MKKRYLAVAVGMAVALGTTAALAATFHFRTAKPGEYDPVHSKLVNAAWVEGAGCPANATITTDGSTSTAYPAANCPSTDSDPNNEGLLFVKSGPTANYAEPYVELMDLKGAPVTELGYDLRGSSECTADAPMFELDMSDGHTYYVGCSSPAPTTQSSVGIGWQRLHWGSGGHVMGYQDGVTLAQVAGTVNHAYIVFQEGQDGGPANNGLAVLDNIDFNGMVLGHGAASPGSSG